MARPVLSEISRSAESPPKRTPIFLVLNQLLKFLLRKSSVVGDFTNNASGVVGSSPSHVLVALDQPDETACVGSLQKLCPSAFLKLILPTPTERERFVLPWVI